MVKLYKKQKKNAIEKSKYFVQLRKPKLWITLRLRKQALYLWIINLKSELKRITIKFTNFNRELR